MIDDMMVRNLSPATQQSYIYAVRRFSEYFNRSPDKLGFEDVRAYQLHLISQHARSGSSSGSRWAVAKRSSGSSLAGSRRSFPAF